MIKYIVITLVFLSAIYTFSFAKSTWKEKNKFGAVGVVIIGLTSIVLPLIILFFQYL